MRAVESRVTWGGLLIVLGVLFLLQTLGIIPSDLDLLWAIVFVLGGLAFLYVFLSDSRGAWWAAIPAFTFLALAGVMAIEQLGPLGLRPLGGTFFLGVMSLGFWAVYFTNQDHWWAIIPGGVLLTLAAVAGFDSVFTGGDGGAVFFFGLAATFALLSVVSTPRGRLSWALIPAAVLFALGVVVLSSTSPVAGYLWPIALILIGLYLLLRSRGPRAGQMP